MKKLLLPLTLLFSISAFAQEAKLPSSTSNEAPAPMRTTVFGGAAVVVTPGDWTVRPLGAFELDAPVSALWRLRGTGAITTAPGQTTLSQQTYHFYAVLAEAQLYAEAGSWLKVSALSGYVTRLNGAGLQPLQSDFVRWGGGVGIQGDKSELFIHYGHDGIRGTSFQLGDVMARARVAIAGTDGDLWLVGDVSVAVKQGLNANVYRIAVVADVGKSIHDLTQLRKQGGTNVQPVQ
jgi:hypothetical protein